MNGFAEDLDAIEADYEFDEELEALFESDEGRRVRRRPVRTGSGVGYYRPRPSNRFVTQAQLQAALAKIGKDVKANAVGIKSVGARVDAAAADQKKQMEALKKEAAERKGEMAKLKSGMQMSALLPLLTSKSITVKKGDSIGSTAVTEDTKLSVAPDMMGILLPMLLMGDGLGGSGGGDSSSMLLLALAFGDKK